MVNIGLFTGVLTLVLNTVAAIPTQQNLVGVVKNHTSEVVVSASREEVLSPKVNPAANSGVKEKIRLFVTAYSSSPDETDDTPFITASGKHVADGILATNLFPFGTKARIPELFGEKVFIIEDRMHHRFRDRVDIWMPTKEDAKKFGKKVAEIEILE